jgi:hypothetical protein
MEQLWFAPSGTLHAALAANDGVDALAGAKNHGTPIELLVTDVVMPNLANWRRNSLDCVRTKNCCSFLVMPARLGSTIKSGTLRPIFSRTLTTLAQIRTALNPGSGQTNSPIRHDALD